MDLYTSSHLLPETVSLMITGQATRPWTMSATTYHRETFFPQFSVAPAHLQGRMGCRLTVLWLTHCPSFSFCRLQSTFQGQRKYSVGLRVPCSHQFVLSMFNEVCGCCPQQLGPFINFWRLLLCSIITRVVRDLHGTHAANNSTECKSVPPLEPWVATNDDHFTSVPCITRNPH